MRCCRQGGARTAAGLAAAVRAGGHGLFAPVRLPDGHLHVDGGVLEGVPIGAALTAAGPQDRVLVLDCGLAQ